MSPSKKLVDNPMGHPPEGFYRAIGMSEKVICVLYEESFMIRDEVKEKGKIHVSC